MRTTDAQFFSSATITASFPRVTSCDDHFIVLSSSDSFSWSWDSDPTAIKFGWNCAAKYIYSPSSSTSAPCNVYGDINIGITINDGTVTFTDDVGCGSLAQSGITLPDSPLYLYVGANCYGCTTQWYELSVSAGVASPSPPSPPSSPPFPPNLAPLPPPPSPLTDCEILLEVYNTMGGVSWPYWRKGGSRIEWNVTEPSNCCAWEGVRCHADRPEPEEASGIGIVERIWLQEVYGMTGTLPVSIVHLGALAKLRCAQPLAIVP